MTTVQYIPHAQAAAFAATGWTITPIIGGSHGQYSVLACRDDPGWRQMTRPARRMAW